MINVFKTGGKWKTEKGAAYTIKTINESERSQHIKDGWVTSLDEAIKPKAKAKAEPKDK